MDYGWRLRGIKYYSDTECTASVAPDSATISQNGFPSELGSTVGVSNLISGLTDQNAVWSDGLNVNPREVDLTHGGAIVIDVNIDSAADIRCVEVSSRSKDGVGDGNTIKPYYPETIAVYWGKSKADNSESGSNSFYDFTEMATAVVEVDGVGERFGFVGLETIFKNGVLLPAVVKFRL